MPSGDIVARGRAYLAANAAESSADVLLTEALDEVERLMGICLDRSACPLCGGVLHPRETERRCHKCARAFALSDKQIAHRQRVARKQRPPTGWLR